MGSKTMAAIAAVGIVSTAGFLGWNGPAGAMNDGVMHLVRQPAPHQKSKAAAKTPPDAPDEIRAATPTEKKAATTAITAQLDAFRKDDYKAASTYQSAGLAKNFPTVDAFRAAIQGSYPQFAHYKAVSFDKALADAKGTHVAILASLTGEDGVTVTAIYSMVLENKAYKIEGVEDVAHAAPRPDAPSNDPGDVV